MTSVLKRVWHVFTCENYAELCSQEFEKPLSFRQQIEFWLHHVICTFCRRSRRQLILIERACHKAYSEESAAAGGERLSEEAKRRIKETLH